MKNQDNWKYLCSYGTKLIEVNSMIRTFENNEKIFRYENTITKTAIKIIKT